MALASLRQAVEQALVRQKEKASHVIKQKKISFKINSVSFPHKRGKFSLEIENLAQLGNT